MANTVYIDQRYITLISGQLKNFRNSGNGLFQFSHTCEGPNPKKRRGYFYQKGMGYNFMCHHCSESTKFSTFLSSISPSLHDEYRMEVFKESMGDKEKFEPKWEEKEKAPEIKKKTVAPEGLTSYNDLRADHPALKVLEKRCIPQSLYHRFYFCRDFYKFAGKYHRSFSKMTEKIPRLVIPYRNKDDEIFGFTCRAYNNDTPKYIELKIDDSSDMIYGLDKVDTTKKIIVVEGPIDSMFLPNAVAAGGASYQGEFFDANKDNLIIVPDNDWVRNRQVYQQVEKMAKKGHTIALLPDTFGGKDINTLIMNGKTAEDISNVIYSSAKSGPALLLDIAFRRKC